MPAAPHPGIGTESAKEFSPFSTPAPSGWSGFGADDRTGFDALATTANQQPNRASQGGSGVAARIPWLSSLDSDPWPNRAVSYERETRPIASSDDFWASLAETANDPTLDYLRDDAGTGDGEKPWWPLTLTTLALFASIGANLYMGWITVGIYQRSLDLADEPEQPERYDDASARDEDEGPAWSSPRRRYRSHRVAAD